MLRILKLCGFDGAGECFESAEAFATRCGIKPRTLTDVLRELENRQLISVDRQRRKVNRIVLGEMTKKIIHCGKFCRHKENNTNIFMAANFAAKESEVERIHRKWLNNKSRSKVSDCEGGGS